MDRTTFIAEMDRHLKLVRTEFDCTQEVMARMLGISKKTLVEIEKGRSSLGWTGAVAFVTLFGESQILNSLLGGEAEDMVRAMAFAERSRAGAERGKAGEECGKSGAEQGKAPALYHTPFTKTMGGHVWWRVVEERENCRIQQNIISQHYRALDREDHRICYSFDLEEIHACLREWEKLGESL